MMNLGHKFCIGKCFYKCSRIGSLKKQSSVFISYTLCSSFVITLCYSHVGVMTIFWKVRS